MGDGSDLIVDVVVDAGEAKVFLAVSRQHINANRGEGDVSGEADESTA